MLRVTPFLIFVFASTVYAQSHKLVKARPPVVANHDGTSNGIAVDYWTIFIFPDPEFHNFTTPLTFSVEEYGSFGTFVTSGGRVSILTTTWVNNEDPKHKRGWGMYLVGQWWRYQSGELRPLLERPIGKRGNRSCLPKELSTF